MLVLSRKKLEQIQIGDNIVITVLKVRGQAVQIGIEAPRQMRVLRSELAFEPANPHGDASPASPMAAKPAASKPVVASPVHVPDFEPEFHHV